MGNNLSQLSKLYSYFLKFPLENFSLYARMRQPTLEETTQDMQTGFGGDCNTLANFINISLQKKGFNSRIIYSDNDMPQIDRTIKIEKPIDKKYHAAVIVDLNGAPYLLDTGLQYEKPLIIKNGTRLDTKTKYLKVSHIKNNIYEIQRLDRGNRKLNLYINLDDAWTPEDHERATQNNFNRDIPLKYGIIANGGKIGLKVTGDQGRITRRTRKSSEILHEGDMRSCAAYLNINPAICQLAYENFTAFRASQRRTA